MMTVVRSLLLLLLCCSSRFQVVVRGFGFETTLPLLRRPAARPPVTGVVDFNVCGANVEPRRRRGGAAIAATADAAATTENEGGGESPAKGGNSSRRRSGNGNGNNNLNLFQRALLAAAAAPFLTHGADLPPPARRLISERARTILSFCAEYLAEKRRASSSESGGGGWDVDLYASGGYVRDILLGRVSPDLDLSLGLSRCPPNVTVVSVAEGMDDFCRRRPDLGISSVDVDCRRSGAAKKKGVDSARVVMALRDGGVRVEIDLLPTIGAEVYEGDDRIPVRDVRGSAEEDSARRDLTIGSMLLEVTLGGGNERSSRNIWTNGGKGKDGATADKVTPKPAASTASVLSKDASELRFVLLDYHGGIEDISTRTLRCPVPRNVTLNEAWDEAIRSPGDEKLARSLGLALEKDLGDDDTARIRALWWAKMMRDDPYRLLRTLRFSSTLGFLIDPSFWYAAALFALRPGGLDSKVSHTRKVDELRKVAVGGGIPGLLKFLGTVLNPPIGGSALRDAFFGVPLADEKGGGGAMVMDGGKALRLASQIPPGLSMDERAGAALLVTLFSCDFENGFRRSSKRVASEDSASVLIADRIGQTLRLVEAVCDGLQAPASIRRAATEPLRVARRILEPLPPSLGMHSIFVRAVGWPLPLVPVSKKERTRQFATMVRLWDVLQLGPVSTRRRPSSVDPRLVMALMIAAANDIDDVRDGSDPSSSLKSASYAARQIEADCLFLLSSCGVGKGTRAAPTRTRSRPRRLLGPQPREGALLGRAVAGLPEVPPRLRSQVADAVHVLARLRGDSPIVETSDQLRTYLEDDCDGLLTKLGREWSKASGGRQQA